MALMMRGRLFPSVLTVAAFWWCVATLWMIWKTPRHVFDHPGAYLSETLSSIIIWGTGVGLGILAAVWYIVARKASIHDYLRGHSLRGLSVTIGEVPVLYPPPRQSRRNPDLSAYGREGREVAEWLAGLRATHPAHARLVEAVLRVFEYNAWMPATHIEGGHGGRSLLSHSLLTAQVALAVARTWKFEGLPQASIGLSNPHYVFAPNDPMVGVIALAHDIGKIDSFLVESGKVVGTLHEHDLVGARMLARMQEAWEIPDADRSAMLAAVGHYHHPMVLPLTKDGRLVDDRTVALMELLIRADIIAGKVESGTVTPDNPENIAVEEISEAPAQDGKICTDDEIWAAFARRTGAPGQINGKGGNSAGALGQKCGGLVYLRERDLRMALMADLGLSSTRKLGDGRYQFTVDLMRILESKGVLFQEVDGKHYTHKRALFRVAFSNSKTDAHLAEWPATIVVKTSADLPELASLLDHPSTARIVRPAYGEHSYKSEEGGGALSGGNESSGDDSSASMAPPLTSDAQFDGIPFDGGESPPATNESKRKFKSMGLPGADFARAAEEVAAEATAIMEGESGHPEYQPVSAPESIANAPAVKDLLLLLIESGRVGARDIDGMFYVDIDEAALSIRGKTGDEDPKEVIRRAAGFGDITIVQGGKSGKTYVGVNKPEDYLG